MFIVHTLLIGDNSVPGTDPFEPPAEAIDLSRRFVEDA
jgi:hypothetical protein